LSVPTLAADTEIVVKTPQSTAVGETFTVSTEIAGNPGFSAVQFTLTYDPDVVECVSVDTGAALSGAMTATNPAASTGAIVAAASVNTLTQDGVLATFTFRTIGSGDSGLTLADVLLSDQNSDSLDFTVTGVTETTTQQPADKDEDTQQSADGTAAQRPTTGSGGTAQQPTDTTQQTAAQTPVEVISVQEIAVEHKFSDTTDHWAESYINTAVERGYFQGYADGSFQPGNPVTRGAFVTVLWRMAGKPAAAGETPFTDVSGVSDEFRSAIAWAYEQGYISGRTETTFAPSASVTRQAAMKILFQFSGGQSGLESMLTSVYNDSFTDSDSLPDWAKAPMYWAYYNQLISGTSDTTLGGGGAASRAQLAKILVNYADKFES
jgi:hypothetical protein